ncbi:ethanolamine utilization protein [Pradoshia eiseniae]|uniref:Ethanolamine utilization protein n=1 Tax=Pradoshia eiseniae TaxID=2064768 RepID=A0A2S7MZV2_9BACI|nr:ethanolamine ammonia-lyase reactivating factor EutA [Pradoshia eiseniae]PQD95361.1 ethanolamine utilization protein [Pradoshia eiseniae]
MEPYNESLLSAGIDIGTSTTKIVVSLLFLSNVSGSGHVPRLEITGRKVIYKSPVYRTPLQTESILDYQAIMDIIHQEYREANIHIEDIQTGAVIITGESAIKENARQLVSQLASSAGDFLVATAGPDLEGILAAKGSGALSYSQTTKKVTANIDIGGGTANIAVVKNGELCGTCTLTIGGRLIEYREGLPVVSETIRPLLKERGWDPVRDRKMITTYMADVLARAVNRSLEKEDEMLLLGHAPDWEESVEAVMFSGGVASCMYPDPEKKGSFDDIGADLACALLQSAEWKRWDWVEPVETSRATVIGAGTQTTEVSGATIMVDEEDLPLSNLPVHRVSFSEGFKKGILSLPAEIRKASSMHVFSGEPHAFALYLKDLPYLSYKNIKELADCLLTHLHTEPLVIVLEQDYAKVLGASMKYQEPNKKLVCIDQVDMKHGDYVDIGKVLNMGVAMFVVKTLAFGQ